jgi:hypothetical protein
MVGIAHPTAAIVAELKLVSSFLEISLVRPGQRGDGYTFYRKKHNDIFAIVAICNPDASFA